MTVATMRRREFHAASAKVLSPNQTMMMPYRGKLGAVQPGFEFKPGFIYAQVRAISARINQNYDGWPSAELKKSYRSFLGKPIFVNHTNHDPTKARGKVVAARYVEAGDDKYIETVMEVDASRFPKLAHEIKTGGMDSVSMGVEAGFTICSVCNNKAIDVPDFCDHVKFHKGTRMRKTSGEEVLVYEKCHKLGFFELSYVFDPADETAVVSRVISANAHQAESDYYAPDPIYVPKHEKPKKHPIHDFFDPMKHYPIVKKDKHKAVASIESRINRLAYGEIEAPEDVDTLREDPEDKQDDDTDDFASIIPSPEELRAPNLDKTKQLDRAQEDQGLDTDRNVEDIEDVGGAPTPIMSSYRPHPKEARAMARNRTPGVLVDPRTGRKYYAADEDPSADAPAESDEELIAEAQDDLEKADEAASEGTDSPDDPASDAGGSDDDYSDQDDGDSDDDGADDDTEDPDGGSGDVPPWMESGDSPDDTKEARRNGNRRSSDQKKRSTRKGAPMSLASRNRVAAAQRPRNHYAGDNGLTDGGPYHTDDNDQGEQESVFISQTPGSEAVAVPAPGDGQISNTENNLVARINRQSTQLQRDIIAYEQITGRRVTARPDGSGNAPGQQIGMDVMDNAGFGSSLSHQDDNPLSSSAQTFTSRRRQAEAVETPDTVNPALSGTDDQSVKSGDWDSIALDDTETQAKDASIHAFAAFDQWLKRTTGKTARQHGNPVFIRRSAARYCQHTGASVDGLFPMLGKVLREARNSEGTNRRSNMRRRADESLETAAPQDRIDVEAPVSNTTDAEAQASQFDLGDFGGNASDNLADPELSPDSQIWAPGEGDSSKTSNRKTDGITAVRYAEAYIAAGLAPDSPNEKWKIAGLAQTMRHGTIVDRIRLLDAVNQTRVASARRTAGVNRGTGIPQNFGQRQMTAGMARESANDLDGDLAMWLK